MARGSPSGWIAHPARASSATSTHRQQRRGAGRRGRACGHSSSSVGHQLDHEAGAALAVRTIFHPDPPAVHPHVLVDQRQPEPRALAAGAPAGAATAGEALEHEISLVRRDARTSILDGDLQSGDGLLVVAGDGDRDLRFAATVGAGVVDEVGDHTGEAPAVAADEGVLGAVRTREWAWRESS